jgi:hypothetical protein
MTEELTELSNDELALELAKRADEMRERAREVERALLNESEALTSERVTRLSVESSDVQAVCDGVLASRAGSEAE